MKWIFEKIIKILEFLKLKQPKETTSDEPQLCAQEFVKELKITKKLLDHIKKNDILFVRMNDCEIEKNNIDPDHAVRPFLVTEKDQQKQIFTGYYLTSNINNCYFRSHYMEKFKLVLSKDKYNLSKNSLVKYQEEVELPYNNIIDVVDTLQNQEAQKLEKYSTLAKNRIYRAKGDLELGDITSTNDNQMYLIYSSDHQNAYGYNISIQKEMKKNNELLKGNLHMFQLDHLLYGVNYNMQRIFPNNSEIDVIDRVDIDSVMEVNAKKKQLKYQQKRKNQKRKHKK